MHLTHFRGCRLDRCGWLRQLRPQRKETTWKLSCWQESRKQSNSHDPKTSGQTLREIQAVAVYNNFPEKLRRGLAFGNGFNFRTVLAFCHFMPATAFGAKSSPGPVLKASLRVWNQQRSWRGKIWIYYGHKQAPAGVFSAKLQNEDPKMAAFAHVSDVLQRLCSRVTVI